MVRPSGGPAAAASANEHLRIAFIVNNYPPRVGGVELHVRNLARRLHEQGATVTVVTLGDEPGEAVEDGIDVVRLSEHFRIGGILGFPAPGATRRIARLLRERDVRVVSVHTRFFPMSWIGLRAGRKADSVVIHTEHGSDHVVSDSVVIRVASRLVDHTFGKYVLRRATKVLGVSESVAAFVTRLSGRKDVSVFYNAIDPAPADIDRTQRSHVVFVGRLVPGKGAEEFVDAVSLLAAEGPALDAEIVGDGPIYEEIVRAISDAGMSDLITMRGRVPLDEVSRALGGAVLMNPSTLAEGFQTTMLEALEAGGSVVSYDLPGAKTLSAEGFPVDVLERQGAAALAAAVRARLGSRWPVLPMTHWYWTERAREYSSLAQEEISRRQDDGQ